MKLLTLLYKTYQLGFHWTRVLKMDIYVSVYTAMKRREFTKEDPLLIAQIHWDGSNMELRDYFSDSQLFETYGQGNSTFR